MTYSEHELEFTFANKTNKAARFGNIVLFVVIAVEGAVCGGKWGEGIPLPS